MSFGKSKAPPAPPAPDYAGAAQATADGNLDMARYTTGANRVNQYSPYGSPTYNMQQTFDSAAYQRAMADYNAKLAANPKATAAERA